MGLKGVIEKFIGSYSDRELKRLNPLIQKIEALDSEYQGMTDTQLKAKTDEFRARLSQGETEEDILPEAFAAVREAFVRTLKKKPFKVQLIGGVVLHQGRIAEMKTGEGKTFVAVLAAYLNALSGKGVHIVTVNDYLAKFQSEQMGKVYSFLGLSVGVILHGLTNAERRAAYNCDITYATNNELGFDYLRDNMVMNKDEMVQRGLNYAIVDEVDSILIDEARTPLIISGAGDKSTDLYKQADVFARKLKPFVIKEADSKQDLDEISADADYIIDEKANNATITTNGMEKAEKYFKVESMSDPENTTLLHHVNQAIKAHGIMKRDRDYVVQDGQVIIVDEFTGRLMYGRRFNQGLHQAIEAKENVTVEKESKTLATITFQNYFRLYRKLSGMTGTAQTEEAEFNGIYELDVLVIPTNKPMIRQDMTDCVYRSEQGKFRAVVEDVKKCAEKGQPVLIGTISIEKSEILSDMLRRSGIKHEVLNAKQHAREAEIVAQAGRFGAVTIATNMAGRGTDILLGGNPEYLAVQDLRKEGFSERAVSESYSYAESTDKEILDARARYKELYAKYEPVTEAEKQKVLEVGGLYIIGTERHESRRIDNQLRGRSGRQGDPGMSRFYISLEDDLMRLFGSEKVAGLIDRLGLDEDTPIENSLLSGTIEGAQKKVEGRNFDMRKHVLQYDDVMNQQRKIIYTQRNKVLSGENLKEDYTKIINGLLDETVKLYCSESNVSEDWDWAGMKNYIYNVFLDPEEFEAIGIDPEDIGKEALRSSLKEAIFGKYAAKETEYGEQLMRELERVVLLRNVNEKWMSHIDSMDEMKRGMGLRAYGQKDPVMEYKFEGFQMFDEMNHAIQEDSVRTIMKGRLVMGQRPEAPRTGVANMQEIKRSAEEEMRHDIAQANRAGSGGKEVKTPVVNDDKVGRNDTCPCGSGKKYKNCCGKNT